MASERVSRLIAGLGARGPQVRVFRAPGRVNIVGEHVDYTGGLVLPFACDRDVLLACVRSSGRVELVSLEERGVVAFDVDADAPLEGWGRYAGGVVAALREAGLAVAGVRGVLSSTVPVGAGLSSSAAVAAAIALALLEGARPSAATLQRAEHLAVGVPCGVMDQVACLHGVAGHAILLDCADVTWKTVQLPASLAFVVVDTHTRRTLDDGRYGARRAEVEAGLGAAREQLGAASPRSMTPGDVARLRLGDVERRRLRHVVSENRRVELAVAALTAGDGEALGRVVDESHRSLREDFEVSSPALDRAVDNLRALPGCLGARLVGAGFAGCVLAVVRSSDVEDVLAEARRLLPDADAFGVRAVDGAGEVALT